MNREKVTIDHLQETGDLVSESAVILVVMTTMGGRDAMPLTRNAENPINWETVRDAGSVCDIAERIEPTAPSLDCRTIRRF